MITSPTLLGPILVWSQQNYQRLLKSMMYMSPPSAAAPTTLLRGKSGVKMDE